MGDSRDSDPQFAVTIGPLLAWTVAMPPLAASSVLLVAHWLQAPLLASVAAAISAALAIGFVTVRSIARPIDEAVGLACRFDAGETDVRLDPARGTPQFRSLARTLNRIADGIVERDMKYDLVSKATCDAVWDWDRRTDQVRWHGQLRSVFGIDSERMTVPFDWWREHIHPDDLARVEASFDKAIKSRAERWSEEYRFRMQDGTYRWFWDRSVMVADSAGEVERAIGCMTDISRQRAAEERIWRLATHDDLTGCPNRTLFQRKLSSLLRAADGGEASVGAVLLIDIDDFRSLNDLHGHDAGDHLLQEIANRLEAATADTGIVFRLGGDEFAVVVPGLDDTESVSSFGEMLFAEFRQPFHIGHDLFPVRMTIGAVLYPKDGSDVRELMQNADIALYAGKASGRNRIAMFELAMRRETEKRLSLFAEIRAGIDASRFHPHYQPVISLSDGSIAGAEALMRWQHPVRGILTPDDFGCGYDDFELAVRLGQTLMSEMTRDYQSWREAGVEPAYVAVNISTAGFSLPDLADRLLTWISDAGIPPQALVVEVTETVLLSTGAHFVEPNLQQLHANGVRIALDDFGTGYASLTHLQEYPVDIIKLDRSFVSRLTSDDHSRVIVATMLELARRLDKTVIAEGVETLEQAQILRDGGCGYAQGFLFARPMPAAEFGRFCSRERALRRRLA